MEQERLLHMEFLQPSVLTLILLCPQEHVQAEAGAEETHLPSLIPREFPVDDPSST